MKPTRFTFPFEIFFSSQLKIFFFTIFFSVSVMLNAQSILWQDIDESSISNNQNRLIIPQEYRTLALNISELENILSQAPLEFSSEAERSKVQIDLPLPDGGFALFNFVESPIMEEELAAKFPELKTYLGKGITEGVFNVRFDFTPSGFHAMIRTSNGTVYIDPYSRDNIVNYICYYKRNFMPFQDFVCEGPVIEFEIAEQIRNLVANGVGNRIGEQLRTYRLALAATGEYTIFHGGTVSAGMNAIVVAMNRVNGIYENEVACRMVLVANNDQLIYTNPSTDPYTNSSGTTMLGQNQSNIDAVIGNANYDIGH